MSTAATDGPLDDLIADAREIPPPFQPRDRAADGQPVNGEIQMDDDILTTEVLPEQAGQLAAPAR